MASTSYESLPLMAPGQGMRIILVRATDAIRLCREDGYQKLPSRRAADLIERLGRREMAAARAFVARTRLASLPLPNLDDASVLALLGGRLRSGDLVVLREGEGGAGSDTDSDVKQRRLVRDIEAKSRGRLSSAGRTYRLVPDSRLGRLADRDSYEVVSRQEAVAVLSTLAGQSAGTGDLAKLLTEAAGLLTRDWRPPLRPDGLILLRRHIVQTSTKPDSGPVLTPSQLMELTKTDWIEVEVVDENGAPYSVPYRLELPNRDLRQGNLDEQGFVGVYKIESGKCKLTLGKTKPIDEAATADGVEEATHQQPSPPEDLPAEEVTQHFEVRLVDELDQGIPGIEVLFSRGDVAATATSDGNGTASADLAGGGDAELTVPDAAALTAALKSRWDQVRGVARDKWVKADDNTTVLPYRPAQLAAVSAKPDQKLRISYQPYVFVARLWGSLFDTNKCFLLPTVLPHIKHLKEIYDKNGETQLLVVGHTDATADPAYNDPLSLERAAAMMAYLRDKVDDWYAWYEASKPEKKRWGKGEDKLMIKSLPEFKNKPKGEDPIKFYQKARGWSDSGSLTKEQRKALLKEYMGHDGTTLPASVEPVAHGCGENFPVSQPTPDESSADRYSQSEDRRVELFFFDEEMGIQPAPPGPSSQAGSQEYPEWVRRQTELYDLTVEQREQELKLLEMHDALFRTDSAVLLPEGEDPEKTGEHQALSTVGLVAAVLRYNEEHPGKRLLVAGHCDTAAGVDYNQPLSEERAGVALACIAGDELREEFGKLCDARNDGVDKTQVIDWVSRQLGWDCQPTRTDQPPSWTTINKFQKEYNAHKAEIKATDHPDLAEDGDFGKLTWQAIFDCYEHALAEELGEDPQRLRDRLLWLDDTRRSLGFSEYFPVDNLGRDQYRSQSNRRVEILFFDPDEEPDLVTAQANPEVAEFYLPGAYEREHLPPMLSAKPWKAYWENEKVAATMGDERNMILDAPGLPAGEPVTWKVEQVDFGQVATMSTISAQDGASQEWADWVHPQTITKRVALGEGDSFPTISFEFQVETGGRTLRSRKPLAYADETKIRATVYPSYDGTHQPEAMSYYVATLWGTRRGTTKVVSDDPGWIVEDGLPPGGISIIVEQRQPIEDESS